MDREALASWDKDLEAQGLWSTVETICLYYIQMSDLDEATKCLTNILKKAVNCKNLIFQDFIQCLNIYHVADEQLDIDKAFGAIWKAVTAAECSLEALTVSTQGFPSNFMIQHVPEQDALWTEKLQALSLESSVFCNISHFIKCFP